jgi:hypothetical protein
VTPKAGLDHFRTVDRPDRQGHVSATGLARRAVADGVAGLALRRWTITRSEIDWLAKRLQSPDGETATSLS